MNEAKIRAAITTLNKKPADETAKESLTAQIGTYRVLVRTPNGKIDADETIENLAFAIETAETSIEGCLTIGEFFAKPKPVFAADPIDGRALRKGKTVSEPIVDWSAVTEERKRLAGYAAMIGELPYREMKFPSEKMAEELGRPGQLPAPWPRLALKLGDLDAKAKGGDKEARRIVEEIDDRLVFKKEQGAVGGRTNHVSPTEVQAPVEVLPIAGTITRPYVRDMIDDVLRIDSELDAFLGDFYPAVYRQISGQMTRTQKVNILLTAGHDLSEILHNLSQSQPVYYSRAIRSRQAAASATATLDLFILANVADWSAARELAGQCFAVQNKNSSFECSAGQNTGAWLRGQMNASKIIVVVVSANMMCDVGTMALIAEMRMAGKVICPYIAKACTWQASSIGSLKPLSSDACSAAGEIMRMLGR